MARHKFSFNFIIVATVLLAMRAGCNDFSFRGTVYSRESGVKKPLDSIEVMVLQRESQKQKGTPTTMVTTNEGTTFTNTKGHFEISGRPLGENATYYLVFSSPSYKTDTVRVHHFQHCDHEMKKVD